MDTTDVSRARGRPAEATTPTGATRSTAPGRVRFLHWLRATHRYVGLWGAVLGLLFGSTGFFLNHRTVLKVPGAQGEERNLQLPLPATAPATAEAMATWLQQALDLDRPATRVRREPGRPVPWGDRTVQQPERWQITFGTPRYGVQAEYWSGNRSVGVRRTDNAFVATLTNLHKGTGAGVGWVLLVDTLAGSIVLLSLSGVLLWTQLTRKRLVGAGIVTAALATTLLLGFQAL